MRRSRSEDAVEYYFTAGYQVPFIFQSSTSHQRTPPLRHEPRKKTFSFDASHQQKISPVMISNGYDEISEL
jgi:hypothetical protein